MLDLDYLFFEKIGSPMHTIIFLHGLGADCHDFEFFSRVIQAPQGHGWQLILPQAPIRSLSVYGGTNMSAWYDFLHFDSDPRENQTHLHDVSIMLSRLLNKVCSENRSVGGKVVLGGFSQGAVVSLNSAARLSFPIDGVIALSGYWLAPAQIRQRPSVFVGHGENDQVIPIAYAKNSYHGMLEKGFELSLHQYAMDHQVCDQEISDMQNWWLQLVQDWFS